MTRKLPRCWNWGNWLQIKQMVFQELGAQTTRYLFFVLLCFFLFLQQEMCFDYAIERDLHVTRLTLVNGIPHLSRFVHLWWTLFSVLCARSETAGVFLAIIISYGNCISQYKISMFTNFLLLLLFLNLLVHFRRFVLKC